MEENNLFDEIDLKKEIVKYSVHWKYFLSSTILALICVFFYLRYTNAIYKIESKVKILDESKGFNLPSDPLSLMSKSTINLENEIEVFKSQKLLSPVVKNLNLKTRYYRKGHFRKTETWFSPIKITSIGDKEHDPIDFNIKKSKTGYIINHGDKIIQLKGSHVTTKLEGLNLLIEPNPNQNSSIKEDEEIYVEISSFEDTIERLKTSLTVDIVGEDSEILAIAIEDANKEKSIATIDAIVNEFNLDGINDRRLISKRTIEFIDDRFKFISQELDSIENSKKEFKQSNNLSFIEADASLNIQQKAVSQDQVFKVETQIALSGLLRKALNDSNNNQLLPANIGLDNTIINGLVSEFNNLILERDKLLKTAGEQNPSVKLLDTKIATLKNNINQSISTYTNQLNIYFKQERSNNYRSNNLVENIPVNEKILRGIERQQKIKEDLYLLLLQKREESAITYAVTSPSIKIIDYAIAGKKPISPKKNILYLAGLLLGILAPAVFIYLYNLFDTKIKNQKNITSISENIPVIGEIPFFQNKELFNNDRSIHSEAYRILVSNLKFLIPKSESNEGNIILVTSSISGEGKTYSSVNIALTLASFNHKVLLIGADMRKPRLGDALDLNNKTEGLSSYLHDYEKDWKDLVIEKKISNSTLNVLLAGTVPPNPANLLADKRFENLINETKKEFDFIVIDATPSIYITDTFIISKFADITMYVVRHNYTEKDLIKFSKSLEQNGKLKNIAYILNGIKEQINLNYGYGYGYIDDSEKKTFKNKLTDLFKKNN